MALCVDLDGTLVKTDTLLEAALASLHRTPYTLVGACLSLYKGLPIFKTQLQTSGCLNVALLPYNEAVLELVRQVRDQGRRTVLITATHRALAVDIANYLGCFDEVYGTSDVINLKGQQKAEFLVKRFGERGFDYIGNSSNDVPVWNAARRGFTVTNCTPTLTNGSAPAPLCECSYWPTLKLLAKTARVHQWSKNILIAVPLLTSHRFTNLAVILHCAMAVCALSCIASATYIFNDLFDIDADRLHNSKRFRPIPSATISIVQAMALAAGLAVVGAVLASLTSRASFFLLATYVICSLSYTVYFKRKLLVDVLMLAGLYTLRILIGCAATHIAISFWLLAFSVFVFFSLALIKRVTELAKDDMSGMHLSRGYRPLDREALVGIGTSSALAATVILALYLNSREVQTLYARPEVLWLLCPLLLYWFSRNWVLVLRQKINDDPLVFVFRDRVSQVLSVVVLIIVAAATFAGNLPMDWLRK
ncbi:MAG: UbiA family prenyltransferase [Candidatus Sulfotelmatobacter sp.]